MPVNDVIQLIKEINGVLKVEMLTNEDIANLIDIESKHDNELIPVINDGLKECFRRDFSLILFKNSHFRNPKSSTLILVREDGKILGHDVFSDEEKEKFKNDDNAHFLSDDFIIFKEKLEDKNLSPKKQYFLLPPVEFSDLDDVEMVKDAVSSSPSAYSDIYLKRRYEIPEDPKIATIIVSFSLKKENNT
ncbi:MAG: hypothetical protein LBB45_00370 [Methanobrevibacter sp.]|jgi:hypothetical protein|nr:hypothetical protein [Candidatus Methanovirga basalitermitum]